MLEDRTFVNEGVLLNSSVNSAQMCRCWPLLQRNCQVLWIYWSKIFKMAKSFHNQGSHRKIRGSGRYGVIYLPSDVCCVELHLVCLIIVRWRVYFRGDVLNWVSTVQYAASVASCRREKIKTLIGNPRKRFETNLINVRTSITKRWFDCELTDLQTSKAADQRDQLWKQYCWKNTRNQSNLLPGFFWWFRIC